MSFASSLKSFFGLQPDGLRQQAAALYSQLVAQARDPWLYREAAVPDTLDGRFEMIVLHLFVYLYSDGATAPNALSQSLLEITIDDMDRNLREMGVGDMGVSRRIKHMGNAMNGRLQAYFQAAKDGGWEEALRRNVYATQTPELVTDTAVQALCGYVRERLGV